MTNHYDHAQVQEFWQYVWERDDVYALPEDATDPTYVLGMFPYTSGTLHMGHVRNYAITDAYARYRRMCGDDVLHPMGWDAFGLPAENAAFERKTDPQSWTEACIRRMREELETMGFGYDWSREVTTCEPEYYRWNQWLFKRLYEAGLVEYEGASVNWCPDCETVLAAAQVEEREVERSETSELASGDAASRDGGPSEASERASGGTATHEHERVCWRCETPVTRRELDQWFFTITDYAEELHDDLEELEGWPDGVREIQRNWIGRQEGARITFEVTDHEAVDVFSTRPETVHGATYLAVSPGHELARTLAETDEAVADYIETIRDQDPAEVGFSGLETEVTAIHPLTGAELPVYVAGYVLDDVGTGAVMGVPAHNERDHEFALAQELPIERAIAPKDAPVDVDLSDEPYTGDGILETDDEYDGLESETAREKLLQTHPGIEADVTYRLRDWLISRQRYWGTPIPMVHCEDCGHVPVPDEELPVELPEFVQTTGNPLEEHDSFRETECPSCGGPARRETDTMDTFVDSSWYYLRFLSPHLEDAPFDTELADEWLPVDVYVGGEEHAILHLLYTRFFTKALADLDLLDRREPIAELKSQGTVLYDGEKMSSSKGNVVTPQEYGAETTRLFVLSAAHPEQDFEWTANNVRGAYDLQQTLYDMATTFVEESESRIDRQPHDEYVAREIDRTIAAVTEEYDRFRFHRAATEIEELARLLRRYRGYDLPHEETYRRGLLALAAMISPMAPHLGEECWNKLRGEGLVVEADWPEPDHEGDYQLERRLVDTTLADVRDIVDTAAIDDPERIELVVAQDWKYEALDLVDDHVGETLEGVDTGDLVDHVLATDLAADSETVASFVADLANGPGHTDLTQLSAADELAILERSSWLVVDEFDAEVTVRRATDDDELGGTARPGKPAIHIT